MSITANTMISRAMRLIQVIGVDQNPAAQEGADGLYALNAMLDAWSIERLMVYQIKQSSHSWPANITSRTIGSGGNFNTTRPAKIVEGTFFRDSGNTDYQVTVTEDRPVYDGIVAKGSTGSFPEVLFADTEFPLTVLYVWPVPNQALTLFLNSWRALQQFTALTTVLSLPPGYQAAIEYNLAIWIAPEFGAAAKQAANDIKDQAALLKQAIKSLNTPRLVAQPNVPGTGRRYNIESDAAH